MFDGGFGLQAEVTFESEPGETYYVQVGGYGLFQDPEFPEFYPSMGRSRSASLDNLRGR